MASYKIKARRVRLKARRPQLKRCPCTRVVQRQTPIRVSIPLTAATRLHLELAFFGGKLP